jgi:NADPH:quinone reductase-like Zn-dependent oxidoreductase
MKALRYQSYGPPENLSVCDVDKPTPQAKEVLVKLHATAVNLTDWEYLTGKPAYARINGLFKPKKQTLGSDIAGVVEAVGADVTGFVPGDAVFGDILYTQGGFAEYVCAKETDLILKPSGLSFVEAAALPQTAVIALQGIRDVGRVRAGQRVLINGAGGGTGCIAIQLAKLLGAEVTGVDSAQKFELMRSLGADHVIDYEKQDFTRNGQTYDLILDPVASRSPFACAHALTPTGRYMVVGGPLRVLLNVWVIGALISLFNKQKIGMLVVEPSRKSLTAVTELIASGQLKPVIDKTYPLDQAATAIAEVGAGKSLGKIVVTIL